MNKPAIISKTQLDAFRASVAMFDDSKVHFEMGRAMISLYFRHLYLNYGRYRGVMRWCCLFYKV